MLRSLSGSRQISLHDRATAYCSVPSVRCSRLTPCHAATSRASGAAGGACAPTTRRCSDACLASRVCSSAFCSTSAPVAAGRPQRSPPVPSAAAISRRYSHRVVCRATPELAAEDSFDEDAFEDDSREVERSRLVADETVYFIFQLDLDVQLQRCLNYKAFEMAKEVRIKREKVDEMMAFMKERKAANTGASAATVQLGAADFAAEGLRLRTEMQRAVEGERYSDAAKFRDLLAQLQTEAAKAQAEKDEWSGGGQPALRLGQRVVHRTLGYKAVVAGWDPRCCETPGWMAAAGVDALPRGARQHFYHLLVSTDDWGFDPMPPVAYAAEELLSAPDLLLVQEDTAGTATDGAAPDVSVSSRVPGPSWVEVYGEEPLDHPYAYILFLGQDARGDYLPCKQLRDKYSVQRRDVYRPGQDGTMGADGGGESSGDDDDS